MVNRMLELMLQAQSPERHRTIRRFRERAAQPPTLEMGARILTAAVFFVLLLLLGTLVTAAHPAAAASRTAAYREVETGTTYKHPETGEQRDSPDRAFGCTALSRSRASRALTRPANATRHARHPVEGVRDGLFVVDDDARVGIAHEKDHELKLVRDDH